MALVLDHQFRIHAIDVGALVFHDAVVAVSSGPSCSVGIIEWAWIPGAIGMDFEHCPINGFLGDMPLMPLKARRSLLNFRSSPAFVNIGGSAGDSQRQRHQPGEQVADGQAGLVAAAVRRRDEHHRLNERQRMDEQRLPQQRLGFRL